MHRTGMSLATSATLSVVLLSGCAPVPPHVNPGAYWAADWLALPTAAPSDTTVAVVDGGVLDHPVLDGRIAGVWEADSLAGLPRTSHGTEMAGLLLGAHTAASTPVAGVTILDVRVLDDSGSGRPVDIAEGIRWAVANGAELIVMSLSLSIDDAHLRGAVAGAISSGVAVVASTTNGFSESPSFPAEYPGVVGVTSLSPTLSLAPLAGVRGADIASPGEQIVAASGSHGFRTISGTSAAAATAASVIATCPGVLDLDESGVIAYAANSGATVASDQRSIPVLRCLKKGK